MNFNTCKNKYFYYNSALKKATNRNGLTTLTSLGVSGFVHPVLHDWVRMIPIKLSYISSIFVRFVLE